MNEPSASLELGMEVEYTLSTRNTGNGGSCASAENVRILPPGSISDNCELLQPNVILDGVVSRPLRSVNPEQTEYAGIIQEVPTSKLSFLLYSVLEIENVIFVLQPKKKIFRNMNLELKV